MSWSNIGGIFSTLMETLNAYYLTKIRNQLAISCSNSAIETLEKDMIYVPS